MDEGITVGDFTISWMPMLCCFWVERSSGEGMQVTKGELEDMLTNYWEENY